MSPLEDALAELQWFAANDTGVDSERLNKITRLVDRAGKELASLLQLQAVVLACTAEPHGSKARLRDLALTASEHACVADRSER